MKRAVSFFLALLILILASCRFSFSGTESAPETSASETAESGPVSPEDASPLSPGLYELLRFDNNRDGDHFSSFAVRGGEAAVCSTHYRESTGAEENELRFIDLETGRVSDRIVMEPWYDPDRRGEPEPEPDPYSEYPGLYLYKLAIGENGTLILFNPYESWAALYDRSGRLLDMIPYGPPVENVSSSGEFPLLPRSCYVGDGFGYVSFPDEDGKEISAFSFSDDPDSVLLFENDYSGISTGKGRDVVCTRYARDGSPLSYRVFDFENNVVRASVTLPPVFEEGDFSWSDRDLLLGEDFALIAVQAFADAGSLRAEEDASLSSGEDEETGDRSESVEFLYLWRFDEKEAEPLEAERATNFSLHRKNLALRDEILKEYEITLHLDEAPPSDYTPWDDSDPEKDPVPSVCVTGAAKLEQYRILLSLKRFLARLPAGFTHEMYTDYPYGGKMHDSFDIYVVKEIPGSAAAFASGFSMEEFLICFATDEFSDSHLPHEFMHLIEVRIHDLRDRVGPNFWEEWDALNPEDYQYGEDDYRSDWFVTWYAATNAMEDRADTFMRLWQNRELPPEERYEDPSPHIQAKMQALIDAIRESYPSVAAAGKAFWES